MFGRPWSLASQLIRFECGASSSQFCGFLVWRPQRNWNSLRFLTFPNRHRNFFPPRRSQNRQKLNCFSSLSAHRKSLEFITSSWWGERGDISQTIESISRCWWIYCLRLRLDRDCLRDFPLILCANFAELWDFSLSFSTRLRRECSKASI
jgi:hypothetical protein